MKSVYSFILFIGFALVSFLVIQIILPSTLTPEPFLISPAHRPRSLVVLTSMDPGQGRWVGKIGHLCVARKPLSGAEEKRFIVCQIQKATQGCNGVYSQGSASLRQCPGNELPTTNERTFKKECFQGKAPRLRTPVIILLWSLEMAAFWWNKIHRGVTASDSEVGYASERVGDAFERKGLAKRNWNMDVQEK